MQVDFHHFVFQLQQYTMLANTDHYIIYLVSVRSFKAILGKVFTLTDLANFTNAIGTYIAFSFDI